MRIIANIGFNPFGTGNVKERAIELIEVAAQSGAHAVCVPHYRADKIWKPDTQEREQTKQYEMPTDWYFDFKQAALSNGLHFIVSPRYPEVIPHFEQIGAQEYHIQNGDIRYEPLLRAVESTGKAALLSTAYSTFEEIDNACGVLLGSKQPSDAELVILHSTGKLPTTAEDAVLNRMLDLGSEFFPLYIGLESFYEESMLDIMSMVFKPAVIMRRLDLEDGMGMENRYSLMPDKFANLARIASVMMAVNNPTLYDGFTESDYETRLRMMRCDKDDWLLPPTS
ncbi:MAG: N-acetylneuraminate synthase family protein [Planctomycetota bacterium]|jgi:sialic acid synthase SpsE